MRFEDLYDVNTWWLDPDSIKTDKHVIMYETKKYRYHPSRILEQIKFDEPGLYTLRGPRQIGKTTTIKLIIKKLITEGINPRKILYFPCDNVKDRFEFTELMIRYVKTLPESKEAFIFVDEITVIPEWQLAIKYLIDNGFIDKSVIMLTGSSAYDLKISSEKLPGRRGSGRDIIYLPLSFNEFLKGFQIDIKRISLTDFLNLSMEDLKNFETKLSFLKRYFDIYWNTGGFPFAVNEFLENGVLKNETFIIITDLILGDAEKYLKARLRIRELLTKLPRIIGQRFSWNRIVNFLENFAESPLTVKNYIEFLSYIYTFAIVYFVDISKRTMRPKKQKKVYPIDMLVLKTLEKLSDVRVEHGHIAEMIVLRHLIKDSEDVEDGLNLYMGPFYWHSNKGNEIDFIAERENRLVPVEVKYQNRIAKSDYFGVKKVFEQGIIVTKDTVFKDQGITCVPLWLFIALVE